MAPVACVWLIVIGVALPARGDWPSPTFRDLGGIGLVRLPTARMAADGTVWTGVTGGSTGWLAHTGAQILPRIEATARSVHRDDIGGDTHRDSGLDLKILAFRETRRTPSVAVGAQNLLGSGDLSGEFVVLGKRYFDFDVTLGLGWGWHGGYGPDDRGRGRGRFGERPRLFGGIEYRTPLPGLALKAEYGAGDAAPPVNLGVVYRPNAWFETGVTLQNGRRVMVRALILKTPPPPSSVRRSPPTPRPLGPRPRDVGIGRGRLASALAADGMSVDAVALTDREATVWLTEVDPMGPSPTVGRTARIMAEHAPASVERLTVTLGSRGLHGPTVSVMRADLERAARSRGSPAELWRTADIAPHRDLQPTDRAVPRGDDRIDWFVTPRLTLDPFNDSGIDAYRMMLDIGADMRPWHGITVGGALRINLADTVDGITDPAVFFDARARGDLLAYILAGMPVSLEGLHLSWLRSVTPELHGRISVGLLEEMYGGVATELLYRPFKARWAIGLTLDHLWKRVPGDVALYEGSAVTTGFFGVHYAVPRSDLSISVEAGRFLGGDFGGVVSFDRDLGSRTKLGMEVTVTAGTDRSRSSIGAGLRLSIPLGLPLGKSKSGFDIALAGLARETGQRPKVPHRLKPITDRFGYGALVETWNGVLD